jgi:putative MATE family efflux protein
LTSARGPAPLHSPLLTAPILPTVWRLAWPGVVLVLFQSAVSIADTHYVGRLGTAPLAGLALVFPFVMMMQMLSAGAVGGGVSSAIARAIGAGDVTRAEALLAHALVLGLALGSLFGWLMWLGGPAVYRILGGRDAVLDHAISYSTILFLGSPAVWVANFCANALRGQGNTLRPSLMLSAAALVHIPLTAMLTPLWGLRGTAWAYVAAFSVGCAILLVMLARGAGTLRLRLAGMRWEARHFGDILGVGLLSSLSAIQTVLAALILTGVVARFGTDALAGYGVGVRLELLLVPLTFAFGAALVPLTGTNVGAGQYERAKHIAWAGAGMAAVIAASIGLTVALFPHLWLDLFTQDAQVRATGAAYLRIVGPFYICAGIAVALYFASQGPKRVGWPVLAGTARLIVAAGGGWLAVHLGAGVETVFALIATGLVTWAALTALSVKLVSWRPATRS